MDLRNINLKDLANINIGSSKKPMRIPDKRGINLARHEDEEQKRKQMRIILIVAAVLLLCLVKFGVIDLYVKNAKLTKQYEEVHEQKLDLEKELEDYDKVLLEYRTYSMDWMDDDNEGRYVSVARRKVLDMVEEKMMNQGKIINIEISGGSMRVEISGMNLQQVSAMCEDIETSPFVERTVLNTATTDDGTNNVNFDIEVFLQRDTTEKED